MEPPFRAPEADPDPSPVKAPTGGSDPHVPVPNPSPLPSPVGVPTPHADVPPLGVPNPTPLPAVY